jgi:hypothetical protein
MSGGMSAARSDVALALEGQGYKKSDAKRMAQRAEGSDFNSLFRSALARKNPRELPAVTDTQLAAMRKMIKGKTMASKKRRTKKKKRNPRKGVMPPGLKKYWAKKRRAKNSRRRKKCNPRPRVRVRTRTVIRYRVKKVRVYPKRRRRSNPRKLRAAKRINLKGFTSSQIKRVASAIRSATGKRVRVVRP